MRFGGAAIGDDIVLVIRERVVQRGAQVAKPPRKRVNRRHVIQLTRVVGYFRHDASLRIFATQHHSCGK